MLRHTLLGLVAVVGLLAVGSGTARADHRGLGGGHHQHYSSGYGYRGHAGYRAPVYGYGYRPIVVAPRVVAPRVVVNPGYGCNSGYYGAGYGPAYGYGGYGTYGYGAPYRSSFGYSAPGFGIFIGR